MKKSFERVLIDDEEIDETLDYIENLYKSKIISLDTYALLEKKIRLGNYDQEVLESIRETKDRAELESIAYEDF